MCADIELVLPNPYGSPAATSWASIASQPPKVMQQGPAARDESSQVNVFCTFSGQTRFNLLCNGEKRGEQWRFL